MSLHQLEDLTILQLISFSTVVGVWGDGIDLQSGKEVKLKNDSYEIAQDLWVTMKNGNSLPMLVAKKNTESYTPYCSTEKLPSMVTVKNIKGIFILKPITRIELKLLSFSIDGSSSSFSKKISYSFIAEYL